MFSFSVSVILPTMCTDFKKFNFGLMETDFKRGLMEIVLTGRNSYCTVDVTFIRITLRVC